MQKPNYRNLEEENTVEMNNYPAPIPVGQPVSPYIPQHQQDYQHAHHPPPHQMQHPHPPPPHHMHQPPPPVIIQAPPPPMAR